MSDTLATPSTPEEQAEVDFGEHIIWRLVGSTITGIGANEKGEIYLSTVKDGVACDLIVGKDERDDIALFEVERVEVPA